MKPLMLIDGHGLAFRAFYALPVLTAPDGTPTNAILGFLNMLLKLGEERGREPVVFFDPKGPTRRHELFAAYKEGRRPTPEEFKAQLPILLELLEAMGLPVLVRDGVEADDLIAATAKSLVEAGRSVEILSADKDLLQVLLPGILALRPKKGVSEFEEVDRESFVADRGFPPERMVDFLALTGDSVDNIPGVAGIGEKTASSLVGEHGDLEGIYARLEELPRGVRGRLEAGRESAFLSRELIRALPVDPASPDELVGRPVDAARLTEMLDRLGLKKLAKRLNLSRPETAEAAEPEEPKGEGFPPAPPAPERMRRFALAPSPDNFGTVPMIAGEGTSPDSDSPLDVATLEELANCPENRLLLWSYRDWLARGNRELPAERLFDASVGHYLMHPDAPGHDPERILGRSAEGPEDLFRIEDVFVASPYREDLARLMGEVDLPLVPVLVEMERRGIAADGAALERLDRDLDLRIRRIEGEVAQKAGVEINLNSPKQVAGLLYERLGLPSLRKTKIGKAPSTDARTLEELAGLPEPTSLVPKLLVEHREIAKIRSGFVRPFLALSMGGARIHSTFDATATGTGRLASRDPNVQNLPVFGDWAHRFRSCLVAPEGYCFVAADYSQIELRVLAWLSGEERLVEAFARNEDVHARTASWIFGVEPDDVSGEQRRFAKVVNFGLLYGMGAHGLAERMGTDRTRAQQLVDRYFGVLPRVRDYLHRSVVEAKERGYARSPFGRIRPLAEVVTVEGRGPGAIERVAVNTPIQSAAADLAKVAMIRFRRVISEICPEAGLVLQVHDSLVVECPETRADEVERLLVETMEGVGMIPVPLRADPKRGRTLAEI